MNIYARVTPVLVAGTLVAGGVTAIAQATAATVHASGAATAVPSSIYVAELYEGLPAAKRPPQGEYVSVDVAQASHQVTVYQRCPASRGRRWAMQGTLKSEDMFNVSGAGISGRMTARGHFIGPNSNHRFTEVLVTVTNGCGPGSKTWRGTGV
jgi:hypothetical protein